MKTIKILFCVALLFTSCLRVDHEARRYDAEGLTYRYGFYYVDNTISKFIRFYKDGDKDESYKFVKKTDSRWEFSYNDDNCSLTGLIAKDEDNDTIYFSYEGYVISDDYSLHVTTTDEIKYYRDYLKGTVRLEISQNNQPIGWGQLVYQDESWVITTGGN
jgi:hypothetical protein